MLLRFESLRELNFRALMEVYEEGNLEKGQELWPHEHQGHQIALAEEEFYQYLRQVFFRTEGAVYLIWDVKGHYVSALRLEPFQDGFLLEALETAPQQRKMGYGTAILQAALEYAGDTKIYSHVHKRNVPSLRIHEKCGFRKSLDYAVYADGSVDDRSFTLCYEKK
jgi:RimJ/RimL family protein N-acetyltransferase